MVLKGEDRYRFQGVFDEPAMRVLLEKAKAEGVVTAFDARDGVFVWFDGVDGHMRELRELRQAVLALIDGGT